MFGHCVLVVEDEKVDGTGEKREKESEVEEEEKGEKKRHKADKSGREDLRDDEKTKQARGWQPSSV